MSGMRARPFPGRSFGFRSDLPRVLHPQLLTQRIPGIRWKDHSEDNDKPHYVQEMESKTERNDSATVANARMPIKIPGESFPHILEAILLYENTEPRAVIVTSTLSPQYPHKAESSPPEHPSAAHKSAVSSRRSVTPDAAL